MSLESALHKLADEHPTDPAPADLADRALGRARRRAHRRARGRAALATVGAAGLAVLIAVGVSTVGEQWRDRSDRAPAGTGPQITQPRLTFLLIGTDAGPERISARPDTLIVASVDTRTGNTALLGLPRSLPNVPFPPDSAPAQAWPQGFNCAPDQCQLNSLWDWAEQDGSKYYPDDEQPGLTATTQAAEQITGLSVDHTVVLQMAGLVELVDAVGGVDVTVHERLPIGGDVTNQQAQRWLEPGRQRLNGTEALWFARSRWSTDDYDRMDRQRCLITALLAQPNYPTMAQALAANVSTSMTLEEAEALIRLLPRMRDGRIDQVTLGLEGSASSDGVGGITADDYSAIRQQVSDLLSGSAADTAGPSAQGGPEGAKASC